MIRVERCSAPFHYSFSQEKGNLLMKTEVLEAIKEMSLFERGSD
jgi:hypothetical protein